MGIQSSLRFGLLIGLLIVTGCSGILPSASPPLKRFALEYAPPSLSFEARQDTPLDAALKVMRFSAVGMLNGRTMYYRLPGYEFGVYNYYLWIDNPADMIGDFLVRDLRQAGLFRAVFSHRNVEEARFRLEGGLLNFFEDDEKGVSVTELSITLLDEGSADLSRRIVFQRSYAASKPSGKSAEQMARALSEGVREISGRLLLDLRGAVGQRLAEDRRQSLTEAIDEGE